MKSSLSISLSIKRTVGSICLTAMLFGSISQEKPLQIGVIGLTHTHVHWMFGSDKSYDEIEIVGIVEPDKELAKRYADQYQFPMDRIYPTMDLLFSNEDVEAVTAFGTIYDHLQIVQEAAPRGIHVMVEKPLAVSLKHAMKMKSLADQHGIHLLTNYETTWYPTNHKALELVNDSTIGALRKIIVRDGHRGPKKIGVDDEFLEWLADPELNGGGAITDFGCYGANLMTWILKGQRPKSVMALTQQLQPENNPKVDDEAILLLEYETMTGIIQASWNWPIGRKDMEIYGLSGAIYSDNRHDLRVRISEGYDGFEETAFKLEDRPSPFQDPFVYLRAVIRRAVDPEAYALSSLENNLLVMEILDAARKSAKSGRKVQLK